MDCTADHLALGVGSFGYGTLGNKVSDSNFVIKTPKEQSKVPTLHWCPHYKGWAFPSWSQRCDFIQTLALIAGRFFDVSCLCFVKYT